MNERPDSSTPYFPFHILDCVLRTIGRVDCGTSYVGNSPKRTTCIWNLSSHLHLLQALCAFGSGICGALPRRPCLGGELWLNSELLSSATG